MNVKIEKYHTQFDNMRENGREKCNRFIIYEMIEYISIYRIDLSYFISTFSK